MPLILLLGWCHLATAVLIIALAIPLVLQKVPPNRWYGVRLKQSLASRDHWYRINYAGGWYLIYWATVLFIASLWMVIRQPVFSQDVTMLFGLLPLVVLAAAWQTWRFALKVASESSAD